MNWTAAEYVSDHEQIEPRIAKNLVKLFEDDCTIPFISRYRKEQTGNMEVADVRNAFRAWEMANQIKKKVDTVSKELRKNGKLHNKLDVLLKSSTTLDQIEDLYAPYKSGSKKTLAERAKSLGLEDPTMKILQGAHVDLNKLVNPNVKGTVNVEEIRLGIKHILADHFLKQTDTQQLIKTLAKNRKIEVQSKFSKSKEATDEMKSKYENYSDFSALLSCIKPHQVLGLNRGEKQKILSVKLVIPCSIKREIEEFIRRKFTESVSKGNKSLVLEAIEDCYARLIQPQICRIVRSELSKNAELASVDVFGTNLKQLLLTPPVKKCPILAIDPGFTHGCKLAVVSLSNQVLDTGVVYLPKGNDLSRMEANARLIHEFVHKHNATKLAIGNGTACRETEMWIAKLITRGYFSPLEVEYCIVNEQGASIYSVTDLACAELPNMDPNLRSAVSLARRVLNPLAEYVKVEPKHLGIGMYQHDVDKKLLKESVDSHVEECVSFVGVDVNTCSQELLQRVAGLNKTRAAKILEYRKNSGGITSRSQLKGVKGIGEKTFQQCAGFIRVFPMKESVANTGQLVNDIPSSSATAAKIGVKRKKNADESSSTPTKRKKLSPDLQWNPLDATSVHPESYGIAQKFLKHIGCPSSDIGSPGIKKLIQQTDMNLGTFAEECGIGLETLKDIINALQQPFHHDIREDSDQPMFRKSVRSMSDLSVGTELSGVVTNLTDFGAFVDIGVGRDGLIHVSQMRNNKLSIGARVEVTVLQLDMERKRIGLRLKQ